MKEVVTNKGLVKEYELTAIEVDDVLAELHAAEQKCRDMDMIRHLAQYKELLSFAGRMKNLEKADYCE